MTDDRFEVSTEKSRETPWRQTFKFNKYCESFPQHLYQMMSKGSTIAQCARYFECSKPTLLKWVEEIPDMKEAYDLGITNFEANFEDMLKDNMIHDDPDSPAPTVNKQFVDLYKSNIKKFADMDKNQGATVVVNNNIKESDDIEAAGKIVSIIENIQRINESKENKEKIENAMKNLTPVSDGKVIEGELIEKDETMEVPPTEGL